MWTFGKPTTHFFFQPLNSPFRLTAARWRSSTWMNMAKFLLVSLIEVEKHSSRRMLSNLFLTRNWTFKPRWEPMDYEFRPEPSKKWLTEKPIIPSLNLNG